MFHTNLDVDGKSREIPDDRRRALRREAHGEVVIAWDHDLSQPLRFQLIDESELGCRIGGKFPILTGMTGILLSRLPEGTKIHRPVIVRWVVESDEDGLSIAGIELTD